MESLTLTSPDISCDHCKRSIEQAVGAIDGVQSVSVDVPSKRIAVNFNPVQTSRFAIVEKLDEEGYPVDA